MKKGKPSVVNSLQSSPAKHSKSSRVLPTKEFEIDRPNCAAQPVEVVIDESEDEEAQEGVVPKVCGDKISKGVPKHEQ
eukprot:CAMPEP_0170487996 /NCGR_PEP_ID=MMETSP0208-20121228/6655_1 /TAXON_ID=197538 /ORGANISM="Strombidium inclinatum, Strain S3" /LENGTH=77 /DNA_ID=CAMNT_0010762427 /DNA_START=527 /DNA_END=760 /DNA_ORIENTATION=-